MTGPSRDGAAAEFDDLRPYLLRVAYSHTGSLADAEDVVQEAWLRFRKADRAGIQNVRAWLTTVVSRLCLDLLDSARHRREQYVGQWLPEPVGGGPEDPADRATLDEHVSMALLVLLESLSPAERCAFLLHDVFGYRFEEVGQVVGRSAPAVRQLAARARRHVESGRPRYPPTPTEHRRVVEAFLTATNRGDLEGLLQLLDPEVKLRSDGGGVVPAIAQVQSGAARVARILLAMARQRIERTEEVVEVNGAPGILIRAGGSDTVMSFTLDAGRVREIDVFRNPDKLRSYRRDPAAPA